MSNVQPISTPADLTYYIAPDLEVIPLAPEEWLCHSVSGECRLVGPLARFFVEQIMPLLKAGRPWSLIEARFSSAESGASFDLLQQLVSKEIVRCVRGPLNPSMLSPGPLLSLLDALHQSTDVALERLATARVAIVGLEGVGAHLVLLLASYGLRSFTLADPFPCQPGNISLLPGQFAASSGELRQDLVAQALRAAVSDPAELRLVLGPQDLDQDGLAQLIAGCDCVVSCFDRGFSAVHHWINRASLAGGIPAVYSEAEGQQGWAGPLVLPRQTACYMCYRMRSVACAVDTNAAVAYEQHLDREKLPHLHGRAVLPGLMPYLASILSTSVLQVILGMRQPILAGRILEFQALTLETVAHPVIQQPSCTDCGCCMPATAAHPTIAELRGAATQPVELLRLERDLVSPRTGIIRELRLYEKDKVEPVLPYIYQVNPANSHLAVGVTDEDLSCWGKGLTDTEARLSGIGEALERYAADWIPGKAIVYARRNELDGPALDPHDLVLYAEHQYETVPYRRYEETSRIGWVRGRSLISGQHIYIPAMAVFLNYQLQLADEYLFPVTSNGLAFGASLAHALLAAICEVLERDAFMITWFARLPARRIDPSSHPAAAIRDLCRSYQRRNVEIGLWRLPAEHPCAVFLALGLQQPPGTAPAVIAGLGADLDPAVAARKAILEVGQIRPSYRRGLRNAAVQRRMAELCDDPRRVRTMHDHALLYCNPALYHAFDFLLDQPFQEADWSLCAADPLAQLDRLVRYFSSVRTDLLYYNLTPPDLSKWGLAATRVILPGFQPVTFGAQEPRLGGERLYDLPRRLGFANARLEFEDLNPYPHPFD